MSTTPLINLSQVGKRFYNDEIETHALSRVDLQVDTGDYIAVAGPSGCGKSTLLAVMGLLDTLSEGSYVLSGNNVSNLNNRDRAYLRNRHIGFVFQSFNLINDLSAHENVELPLTYRSELARSQRRDMVSQALERVDMAHRARHYPTQLSGGQQQRVAVARAIVGQPSIILADEPTGNLDTRNAQSVMGLLDELHTEGATICMVTHDERWVAHARRRVDLLDGQLVDDRVVDHHPPE